MSQVSEAVIVSRIRRGHDDRISLGNSSRHGEPGTIVDVANRTEGVGLTIVGAKGQQIGSVFQGDWDQLVEVL